MMPFNTNNNNNKHSTNTTILTYETSQTTNTTFVQAHPSTFRAVVQHLTGSSATTYSGGGPPSGTTTSPSGARTFKLHERRHAMGKLETIKLQNNSSYYGPKTSGLGITMVSPVSTLDGLGREVIASPTTPTTVSEEQEMAIIAEKGFYLHPTVCPLSNNAEPKLLPLFPLHSPRET